MCCGDTDSSTTRSASPTESAISARSRGRTRQERRPPDQAQTHPDCFPGAPSVPAACSFDPHLRRRRHHLGLTGRHVARLPTISASGGPDRNSSPAPPLDRARDSPNTPDPHTRRASGRPAPAALTPFTRQPLREIPTATADRRARADRSRGVISARICASRSPRPSMVVRGLWALDRLLHRYDVAGALALDGQLQAPESSLGRTVRGTASAHQCRLRTEAGPQPAAVLTFSGAACSGRTPSPMNRPPTCRRAANRWNSWKISGGCAEVSSSTLRG